MPPRFSFMPPRFSFMPPRFISCPPTVFFGRKKWLFLAGKNVEICDFRQKKPSDIGKDLFFWRSPAFGWKKTLKFRPEKAFGNRRKPLPPYLVKLATPLALWLHLCLTFGFAFSIWLCSGWLRLVGSLLLGSLLLACSKSNKAKNHSYSGAGNPPISTNQNTAK